VEQDRHGRNRRQVEPNPSRGVAMQSVAGDLCILGKDSSLHQVEKVELDASERNKKG
jgi:hypothetical protein